jgi:hypothetical protein
VIYIDAFYLQMSLRKEIVKDSAVSPEDLVDSFIAENLIPTTQATGVPPSPLFSSVHTNACRFDGTNMSSPKGKRKANSSTHNPYAKPRFEENVTELTDVVDFDRNIADLDINNQSTNSKRHPFGTIQVFPKQIHCGPNDFSTKITGDNFHINVNVTPILDKKVCVEVIYHFSGMPKLKFTFSHCPQTTDPSNSIIYNTSQTRIDNDDFA